MADEKAGPSFPAWLDERCRQLSASDHLDLISEYAWIGVWSSAVDSIWPSAFEKPWREVQRIYSERHRPPDPRNRKRLHCTFLYGCTSRTEPDERFPTSKMAWLRRRTVAQTLAYRMVEAIGPLGTLAIDGYSPDDWLRLDDLAGLVLQLQKGQCHLFSANDRIRLLPEISALVADGNLILHEQPLASVIGEGFTGGLISSGHTAKHGDLQRAVSFSGGTHSVPRDLWVPLSSTAQLVGESLLGEAPPLSADGQYFAFRQFLGGSSGRVDWEGIGRGYSFQRDFESRVEDEVSNRASRKEISDRPVLLHGATGTGKSTALASLAYHLAKHRTYPVVHIRQDANPSAFSVIDSFCQWAEGEGAPTTVVIWDAMREMDWYADMARRFAGRGRRVILIGSTYRIGKLPAKYKRDSFEAPTKLSASESARLSKFLTAFDSNLGKVISLRLGRESSFLAFLYRLLPPTRAAVRSGVVKELEHVERSLIRKASAPGSAGAPKTTLGHALLEAGLIPQLALEKASSEGVDTEQFNVIEDLTALVMVAAQFGLSLPLELLLRATGELGHLNVAKLFDEVDLVRWEEDAEGNFLLGARSRLEAELIVSSRLGSTNREVDFAHRLIVEARSSESAISGQREVDFVTALVRALGAQGVNPEKYRREFPRISQALQELREERGLENPRLMLQEANLLREFAIWSRKHPWDQHSYDAASSDQALEVATEILSDALEMSQSSPTFTGTLLVELAATYAARAQGMRANHRPAEQLTLFRLARNAVSQAREKDQESYYPLDVLAWATRDILQGSTLTDEDRSEAIAEVLSAFELVTPEDLAPSQVENYHKRRQEFATAAQSFDIADDSFEALAQRGSGAGVYLRTRSIADPSTVTDPLSDADRRRIHDALTYMTHYPDLVAADDRCLNLRFDLWWLLNAGGKLFSEERKCLAFNQQQWQDALQLITAIEETGRTYRDVPLAYIRGVSEFHRGDFGAAFETFSDLETRSDEVRGRRRIIRSYLASDPQGMPRTYQGEIAWVSRDLKRGEVYVDSLRRRVAFIPAEFRGRDLKPGANLGSFHIGFNMLGIIADPERFLSVRGGRTPE
ncbi:hypothetical protein [Kitasatospora arboriphila]|uniref:P-loop NTPase n=1 Tax=Kitasatospora arboriphila TaxID=258052 RepID=UPI0031E10008